jgi:hypothetical protein
LKALPRVEGFKEDEKYLYIILKGGKVIMEEKDKMNKYYDMGRKVVEEKKQKKYWNPHKEKEDGTKDSPELVIKITDIENDRYGKDRGSGYSLPDGQYTVLPSHTVLCNQIERKSLLGKWVFIKYLGGGDYQNYDIEAYPDEVQEEMDKELRKVNDEIPF